MSILEQFREEDNTVFTVFENYSKPSFIATTQKID